MALGVPAKLRLDAVEPELMIQLGARQYVENGARYRRGAPPHRLDRRDLT